MLHGWLTWLKKALKYFCCSCEWSQMLLTVEWIEILISISYAHLIIHIFSFHVCVGKKLNGFIDFYPYFAELGGAVQLMGIVKLLIDPENMMATANVRMCS